MAAAQPTISEFYYACRNNNISLVRSLVESMTPEQINIVEGNGSTALHAASYYGNGEIVELLLEKGASRSIRNRYSNTPYEEGRTDQIKELFLRKNTDDKFVGDLRDELEWIEVGEQIDQKAKSIRQMLETYSNRERKKKKKILIEMIELGDYHDIEKIKWHFEQANSKKDPTFVLKAYTEETEFYTRLNKSLAKVDELDPDDESQRQLLGFLNLICCHPNFRKYDYQGETFRGMKMDAKDLNKYKTGAKIMTKSLLSTSKVRHVAEDFATKNNDNGNTVQKACLCKYKIRKAHTALDIQQLSAYPHEQEVLVIPYSAFEVVNVKEIKFNNIILTEIELRQCKSHIQTYKSIAVGGGLVAAMGALAVAAEFITDHFTEDQED